MFGGLVANAQTHEQLAKLESGNETIRRLFNGLTHLLHGFLRLQIDTKCHAQHHSDFRHLGCQLDSLAETGDQVLALVGL